VGHSKAPAANMTDRTPTAGCGTGPVLFRGHGFIHLLNTFLQDVSDRRRKLSARVGFPVGQTANKIEGSTTAIPTFVLPFCIAPAMEYPRSMLWRHEAASRDLATSPVP